MVRNTGVFHVSIVAPMDSWKTSVRADWDQTIFIPHEGYFEATTTSCSARLRVPLCRDSRAGMCGFFSTVRVSAEQCRNGNINAALQLVACKACTVAFDEDIGDRKRLTFLLVRFIDSVASQALCLLVVANQS